MHHTYKFLNDREFNNPSISYQNDTFLSPREIDFYQQLLPGSWTPGPSVKDIFYFSKDLYNHYDWKNNWDKTGWKHDAPPEWENLYKKIKTILPKHFVHWVDLKITPPLSSGTPIHQDKDPWQAGGSDKFYRSLSVLCNLNHEWDDSWGGAFITHKADEQTQSLNEFSRIAIKPGQLVVMENCFHSIEPIIEFNRPRISFILQVLEYK